MNYLFLDETYPVATEWAALSSLLLGWWTRER